MTPPVFISYARGSSGDAARALHAALGPELAFLDTEDIELGEVFAQRLTDALLGSRVVVAFVDRTYFQRWYCLREWLLARAPFDAAMRGALSASPTLLDHVVIALDTDIDDRVLNRLPPILRTKNWPAASSPW